MRLCSKTLLAAALLPVSGDAQITLDGTMGPSGSLAGPDVVIAHTLGTARGPNLFHSFSAFNIHAGESATFTGPAAIDNVIGRVTGGSSSVINGVLRSAIPSADVYLVNPNGVMFKEGASLDVQGSFYASTANALLFTDGASFGAAGGEEALLTSAPPSAFGFVGPGNGAIEVSGSTLEVPAKATIALVGGDIAIAGGAPEDPVTVGAAGGRIELVSVAAAGEVTVPTSPTLRTLRTSGGGDIAHGDISVTDAVVSVSAEKSGSISIRGGRIVVGRSSLLSDTVSGDGGDVSFEAVELTLSDSGTGGSRVRTRTAGTGNGGDIRVTAGTLLMADGMKMRTESRGAGAGGSIIVDVAAMEMTTGADVETFTFASGRGGSINVNADALMISGGGGSPTSIRSTVVGPFALGDYEDTSPGAKGAGGDVTVVARSLELPGGNIESATYGTGRGGDVMVDADRVLATNAESRRNTGLRVRVGDGDVPEVLRDVIEGDAGNLTVNADSVTVRDGAIFDTATFGAGRAGDLAVSARSVLLSGDGAERDTGLRAGSFGAGAGGALTVDAGSFEVRDGAVVSANTRVAGPGGSILIDADRVLVTGGQGITVLTGGTGDAGTLTIRSGELEVRGPASVSATTGGSGTGGDIVVDAGRVLVSGGGANIGTSTIGSGNSGAIFVKARQVEVQGPSAFISGQTFSAGRGGDVRVEADSVVVSERGLIRAATSGTGDAGDVTLVVDSLLAVGDGEVPPRGPFDVSDPFTSIQSSSLPGERDRTPGPPGDAGDVSVTAKRVELRDGATVESITLGSGKGGSVSIRTGSLVIRSGSRIDVSTLGAGAGGDVDVTARTITLAGDGVVGFTGISAVAEAGAAGDAGDIRLGAGETFDSSGASVSASADESDGGNIDIVAKERVYLLGASIDTAVRGGAGRGGNISIDPEFVILNSSRVTANAFGGPGGNIRIVAGSFLADPGSTVDASSAAGIDGTVDIESPDVDIASGIALLPGAFLDAAALLRAPCAARGQADSSTLSAVRRSGLPVDPDGYIPSPAGEFAWRGGTEPGLPGASDCQW